MPLPSRRAASGQEPPACARTRQILQEPGYGAAEVEALLARGIVAESWSDQYLPD